MQVKICLIVKGIIVSLWAHQALCQLCALYWLPYDLFCYKYFKVEMNYSEAKKYCESVNASLIEDVPKGLELRLLTTGKQNETFDFWCEANQAKGAHGTFVSKPETEPDLNFSTVTQPDHNFSTVTQPDLNFSTVTQPDLNFSTVTQPDLNFPIVTQRKRRRRSVTNCCLFKNMMLDEAPCKERRSYICVKNSSDICPQNTTLKPRTTNWEAARNHCQCLGSDLISFREYEDMQDFLNFAKAKNKDIWIGLRWETSSKDFLWSDGSPVSDSVLNEIHPETKGQKFCIAYISKNSTWEATDCELDLHFICHGQNVTTASTEHSTAGTSDTTPETEVATNQTSQTTPETEAPTNETSETTPETEVTTNQTSETTPETEAATKQTSENAPETEASTRQRSETTPETEVTTKQTNVTVEVPGIVLEKKGNEEKRTDSSLGYVISFSLFATCGVAALTVYMIRRVKRKIPLFGFI